MTIEHELHRLADAFDSIAKSLARLSYPPAMFLPPGVAEDWQPPSDALTRLTDPPDWASPGQEPPAPPPIDYMSGIWKRRDGHTHYDTPAHVTTPQTSSARLDPWVRVDVPAVEPAQGSVGIKQEDTNNGTSTSTSNERRRDDRTPAT